MGLLQDALDHVDEHGFGDNVDCDSIIEQAARTSLRSQAFVADVAGLKTDVEMQEEGGDGWENDDAWATLHQLIGQARAIAGDES